MAEGPLRTGQRVICYKAGPYQGMRGRVEDIFAGQAVVEFESLTVCEPIEMFEPV